MIRRVAAVVAAIVVYAAAWYFGIVLLFALATAFGFDVPWYHEVPPRWWSWLWGLIWLGGLITVVWWVGFRLPWWRRDRPTS